MFKFWNVVWLSLLVVQLGATHVSLLFLFSLLYMFTFSFFKSIDWVLLLWLACQVLYSSFNVCTVRGEVVIQNFLSADWRIYLSNWDWRLWECVWLGPKADFQVGNKNSFLQVLCTWLCRCQITIFLGDTISRKEGGNEYWGWVRKLLCVPFLDSFIWFLSVKVIAELWNETQEELAEVPLYLQT